MLELLIIRLLTDMDVVVVAPVPPPPPDIRCRELLAGVVDPPLPLLPLPLPLEAIVAEVGVETEEEAQLSGVPDPADDDVEVVVVAPVLAQVVAADAGVLLAAKPEALVAGTGEAGM